MSGRSPRWRRFLRDNGLGLGFGLLFLAIGSMVVFSAAPAV